MRNLRRMRRGQKGQVVGFNYGCRMRRRMMDMGITKGTEVEVKRVAPFGDPIEICVRGYNLSLRKNDAENIIVK